MTNFYTVEQTISQHKTMDTYTLKDEEKGINGRIRDALNTLTFSSEEEKGAYENKINQKIKSGAKLTASELNYIRRTNPELYLHVMRVQMKREMMEQKLKNCRSKEEVEEVIFSEISNISKKDPDRELIIKAITDASKEFKATGEYKKLPEKKEDEKNEQKKNVGLTYNSIGEIGTYNEDLIYSFYNTNTDKIDLKF